MRLSQTMLLLSVGIACLSKLAAIHAAEPAPGTTVPPRTSAGAESSSESIRGFANRRTGPDLRELPLDKIQGPYRDRVIQILQKPTAFHPGRTEMFPCDPTLLEWLIRHPVAVGDYWKQLGMTLTAVEPEGNGFVCRDNLGSVVHFHPVCETANLRIAYCVGETPAGILPIKMRAELVVVHRYRFESFEGAGSYVVQQLDGYATASGVTLKIAMKLAPGQSEQMVESCVQEMKIFFSVMCRLMQLRPHWSLEKLPSVAERLTATERIELDGILRALPPTRRSFPIIGRLDDEDAKELAIKPEVNPTK